jgi:hypothetical protein
MKDDLASKMLVVVLRHFNGFSQEMSQARVLKLWWWRWWTGSPQIEGFPLLSVFGHPQILRFRKGDG